MHPERSFGYSSVTIRAAQCIPFSSPVHEYSSSMLLWTFQHAPPDALVINHGTTSRCSAGLAQHRCMSRPSHCIACTQTPLGQAPSSVSGLTAKLAMFSRRSWHQGRRILTSSQTAPARRRRVWTLGSWRRLSWSCTAHPSRRFGGLQPATAAPYRPRRLLLRRLEVQAHRAGYLASGKQAPRRSPATRTSHGRCITRQALRSMHTWSRHATQMFTASAPPCAHQDMDGYHTQSLPVGALSHVAG